MTTYTPPSSAYQGHELKPNTDRPGSNAHEAYPSRMGNTLKFRDGRTDQIKEPK